MQFIYNQDKKVLSTLLDSNMRMGLIGALQVVQDNMCEYFKELGCDGPSMIPICNSFFVVTKTKIKFNNYLNWLEEFKACSQVSSRTRIKLNLCTDFISKDGNFVSECVQEMCPIDATERTIRMINSTLFPDELENSKTSNLVFEKMQFCLEEDDLILVKKVDVANIDFYRHTNNVEYVRMMLSTLDFDFVLDNKIEDFEIHYISESRYNDELKVYRKIENNTIQFEIKRDEKTIVKAQLKLLLNKH
jgi:acyl-ACP thioesterase